MKKQIKKQEKLHNGQINKQVNGITLIALVVTVVVLLILAGISINLLWGEHGILNSAKNAGVQAKIAEIEDQANVIYKGLETEKLVGTKENITMGEIATKLQENGYTIEQETGAENVITGITLDKTSLTLAPNEQATITVTPKQSTDTNVYYAVIEGKAYRMDFTEGGVIIQKTEADKEITPSENKVDATSSNEEIIGKPTVNGMVVNITAKKVGIATITVTYKGQTATCEVQVKIKPAEGATADVENVTFSTAYGKIDVIWLQNGTNTPTSTPNAPELYSGENALKPVTWTYDETKKEWSEDSTEQTNSKGTWYNYISGAGTQDNNSSMWANAKNPADGSYFVWIPRYAYRITYYENDPTVEENKDQEPTGYYDGLGMWKASDGGLKCALESGIETVDYNGEKYIVHPAFMKDNEKTDKNGNAIADFDRGGWDKNLTGFWIAKYEMSGENNSGSPIEPGNVATSNTVKLVSKPGVASWRSINVANCYANSLSYDTSKKSHLIKNSEWGAVAYLTQSSYGRNGHEIDINNSSTYITGNGGGSTNATWVANITNAYNTQLGAKVSTTGNIYGVYDMSGGSYEYTAIFNKSYSGNSFSNTDANYKPATGNHFASTNGNSTQYATAYINSEDTNNGSPTIYSVSKTGDGIKEVYTGTSNKGWNGDCVLFVNSDGPFARRGGYYMYEAIAGVFYSSYNNGNAIGAVSFRVSLAL